MRWLLRLYPRDWRRRYGPEMEALLTEMRPGPRAAVDLLRGAVDARLHPQFPRRRRRGRVPPPLVALLVLLSPLATLAVGAPVTGGRWEPMLSDWQVSVTLMMVPNPLPMGAAAALALFWSLAAVCGVALRSTLLASFCTLVAFRFVADGVLVPLGVAYGTQLDLRLVVAGHSAWWIDFDRAAIALWAVFAAIVLRRTWLPWPAALAAGGALELLAGATGVSLPVRFEATFYHGGISPALVEPLRVTAWAAALTLLCMLRRPRRGWDGWPPGDAGVRPRPGPGAPPLLAAGARLDDHRSDRIASRG